MPEPQTSDFPALPRITGDLMLETFSHKSLNLSYDPEMSTDNERLIELGRTVLEFAVTRYLYDKLPIVPGKDIPVCQRLLAKPKMDIKIYTTLLCPTGSTKRTPHDRKVRSLDNTL